MVSKLNRIHKKDKQFSKRTRSDYNCEINNLHVTVLAHILDYTAQSGKAAQECISPEPVPEFQMALHPLHQLLRECKKYQ